MYKCSECELEYDLKPDYCECGNDVFLNKEEPKEEPVQDKIINEKPIKEDIIEQKSQNPNSDELLTDLFHRENIDNNYEKQSLGDFLSEIDFKEKVSWIIFVLCILCSIFSIKFLGNGILNAQNNTTHEIKPVEVVKNIPTIDSLWEDTAPTQQSQPSLTQPAQPVTTPTKPQKFTPARPQPVAKPKHVTQKPVAPLHVAQKPIINKPVVYTPIQPSKPIIHKTQPVVNYANRLKELNDYKIKLRNTIASDIDFASIIGDGECTVKFKISTSGVLKDKSFERLSSNDSINAVVHSAIVKNPSYIAPPIGYKGEFLRLCVKMTGQNYEVTLK